MPFLKIYELTFAPALIMPPRVTQFCIVLLSPRACRSDAEGPSRAQSGMPYTQKEHCAAVLLCAVLSLVADRKPSLFIARLFKLVHQGNRIVFH
ncbi:hypothetical protein C7378_3269 [Acidipila rosea]|uniref:Uncharacterized protein n=1 Tax=Acidipila rosea TaxID=768535 RepID=A0A4R1L3V3_9BACT|nr:hypothetical protein C7378_3269 [Acidipila rosea]